MLVLIGAGTLRILHTSDWHLGSSLEGVSRDEDHAQFLAWLTQTLEAEKIDVLVIAGDVFDQAHPAAEAQRLFFRFLSDVSGLGLRKVVVVGGNHDSAARLDAPKDVLGALSVHVVGGISADESTWDRALCPIDGKNGGVDAAVLAVPFVHEYRLGVRTVMRTTQEIQREFEAAFTEVYRKLVDRAHATFGGVPVIATGHLNCEGWEPGDAPVDVHMVGTVGALPASIFDPRLQYVALGHIHRSYRVGQSRAYYSGTPVATCLKEARTPRAVRIVDLNAQADGPAAVRTLEVPCWRHLVELAGSPDEVASQLRVLSWQNNLPPIVYARVFVERYATSVDELIRKSAEAHGEGGPHLVEVRQLPISAPAEVVAKGALGTVSLRDLSPEEVFLGLCRDAQEPADEPLLNAFRSLLSQQDDAPSAEPVPARPREKAQVVK